MSVPVHEAAARAWFDRIQAGRMDVGGRRADGKRWQWEDLTDHDKVAYRALIEPVVAAALTAYENGPTCDAVSPNGLGCEKRSGHPGEHVSLWKERWTGDIPTQEGNRC